MVPRCPVSRCQSPQFWWSRNVRSRVFSRPTPSKRRKDGQSVRPSVRLLDGVWHSQKFCCSLDAFIELPAADVMHYIIPPRNLSGRMTFAPPALQVHDLSYTESFDNVSWNIFITVDRPGLLIFFYVIARLTALLTNKTRAHSKSNNSQ